MTTEQGALPPLIGDEEIAAIINRVSFRDFSNERYVTEFQAEQLMKTVRRKYQAALAAKDARIAELEAENETLRASCQSLADGLTDETPTDEPQSYIGSVEWHGRKVDLYDGEANDDSTE